MAEALKPSVYLGTKVGGGASGATNQLTPNGYKSKANKMKKIVVMIFPLTVLFVFAATSLPRYAAKKDSNRVQQPAGDDNVIYSCYKKVNGQTRIVSSPDDCRPSEESISWNTTGIDLSKTYAISCPSPSTGSCSSGSGGWVLPGHAECPSGAVLIRAGTPVDMADKFQAICTQLDVTGTVDPAISIRCVGTPPPSCANNCSDPVCANDPACQPPAPPVLQVERKDFRERLGRVYQYERLDRDKADFLSDPEYLKTQRIPVGIAFFHPSEFSAQLKATYFDQKGEFIIQASEVGSQSISGNDRFRVVDTVVSYRLPKRFDLVTLGVKNLFDKSFHYTDPESVSPTLQPKRMIFGKLTLAF
jgi:hypothetical protein